MALKLERRSVPMKGNFIELILILSISVRGYGVISSRFSDHQCELRPVYLGCFSILSVPTMRLKNTSLPSGQATPERCVTYCGSSSTWFVSMHNRMCVCGRTLGKSASTSGCRQRCSGNTRSTCGGPGGKHSVYSVPRAVVGKIGYLGCFSMYNERIPYRVWRYRDVLIYNNLKALGKGQQSPKACLKHCQANRMPYAAVTMTRLPGNPTSRQSYLLSNWLRAASVTCLCGESYGSFMPQNDHLCEPACKDDSRARCGSVQTAKYAVYKELSADHSPCLSQGATTSPPTTTPATSTLRLPQLVALHHDSVLLLHDATGAADVSKQSKFICKNDKTGQKHSAVLGAGQHNQPIRIGGLTPNTWYSCSYSNTIIIHQNLRLPLGSRFGIRSPSYTVNAPRPQLKRIQSHVVLVKTAVKCRASRLDKRQRLQREGSGLSRGSYELYSCQAGWRLVGAAVRFCQMDGSWSHPLPSCQAQVYCFAHTPSSSLRMPSQSRFLPGQSVQYSCNEGYQLRGTAKLTCRSNGQWNVNTPFCQEIRCRDPGQPAQARRITSGPHLLPGMRVTYVCNDGFKLVNTGGKDLERQSVVLKCLPDGHWDSPLPFCKSRTCTRPPALRHGHIQAATTLVPGSPVVFSCHQNYRLTGLRILRCLNTGKLSGPVPTCQARQCPCMPAAPLHGQRLGDSNNVHDRITFSCDPGYELVGDHERECLATGVWSGSESYCQAIVQEEPVREQGTPPSFENSVAEVITTQVSHLLVNCTPNGHPPPRVSWMQIGEKPLDSSSMFQLENGSLLLLDVKQSNKLNCMAENGEGQPATQIVVVTVAEFPRVWAVQPRVTAAGGQTVTLQCKVSGKPFPHVTWRHSPDTSQMEDKSRWRIDGGQLRIVNATLSDAGTYSCIAQNRIGNASAVVTLAIQECLWAQGGQKRRIIGGRVWPRANATWQAMVWDESPKRQGGNVVCGAIVIRKRFVLTAAHCVEHITLDSRRSGRFLIKAGKERALKIDTGEQVRRISSIHIHPRYDNFTLENDIALLAMDTGLQFQENIISRIALPEQDSPDLCLEQPQGSLLFTGWGRRSPLHEVGTRRLRGVILPIVSSAVCKQAFPLWPVTAGMLCAGFGRGEKEPCHGDSGGPAAAYSVKRQEWVLVGVISWGGQRCAQPDKYSVVTRLSHYIQWINSTINFVKSQQQRPRMNNFGLQCLCQ